MNKLFVGIVAVALLALMTTAFADTFPVDAGPGNLPPEIYLIKSEYDICSDGQWDGSRPYIPVNGIQDAQYNGCIDLPDFNEIRFDEYAFTGEQMRFVVVVRDLNGAEDIGYAYFTVDGEHEALCQDYDKELTDGEWCNQIPEKPFADCGFQEETDKAFICILTVEPSWYGESFVSIEAKDQAGSVTDDGIAQWWFFNPAIIIDLSTNNGDPQITFEDGYPGQTVMSTNKLMVTNLAEGGVDLWAFIAADDLTDPTHSGALCPKSNVLDVNKYMEFRCKIGTIEDDHWDYITNKDTSEECTYKHCLGAEELLYGYEKYDLDDYSIIKNQGSAECQFRLEYPVPCIGSFTEGNFHVIVRVV